MSVSSNHAANHSLTISDLKGRFNDSMDSKSIRFDSKEPDNFLHTRPKWKFVFTKENAFVRSRQRSEGADLVARAIENELRPLMGNSANGVGTKVLSKLGLSNRVTVGDLSNIRKYMAVHFLNDQWKAESHSETLSNLETRFPANLASKNRTLRFTKLKNETTELYQNIAGTRKDHGPDSTPAIRKAMGATYVAKAIDNELGVGIKGQGEKLLAKLGLSNAVTVGDLAAIRAEVDKLKPTIEKWTDNGPSHKMNQAEALANRGVQTRFGNHEGLGDRFDRLTTEKQTWVKEPASPDRPQRSERRKQGSIRRICF